MLVWHAGCDPTGELHRLAQAEGFTPGDRLHTISLGQGQGPLAQGAIEVAAKQGDRVHLYCINEEQDWKLCGAQLCNCIVNALA